MVTLWDGFVEAFLLLFNFDYELYQTLFLSIIVSGLATIVCCVLGIPLGALLALKKFRGIEFWKNITYTLMGLPSVVAGLFVYLLVSRSGPFGYLGILYTPTAMIIAQIVIGLPITMGISIAAVASVPPEFRENARSLGATESQTMWIIIKEARIQLIAAVITTFSTCISEVGAVSVTGGNIRYRTRTLTTATVLATNMGEFGYAMALGLILLIIAFLVNVPLIKIQKKKGFLIK
jgi:tungstate transport system permease protein